MVSRPQNEIRGIGDVVANKQKSFPARNLIAGGKNGGMQATATATITGRSKFNTAGGIDSPPPEVRVATPITVSRLKMLLPTTLPTAISRSPRRVATMDVANSGREVPMATMVKPMTTWLMPKASAISTAPKNKTNREPTIRIKTPSPKKQQIV